LHHRLFELVFGLLIVFNLVLVIVETDAVAREEVIPTWVEVMGWVVLCSFTLEMALRLFVQRSSFFLDGCNCLDLCLVVTDVVMNSLSAVFSGVFPISILRIIRLCKLSRVAKAFHVFPELRLMMAGLLGSAKAIFWGGVLILFSLLVWSVIAVQFIHPLNLKVAATGAYADCERCSRAYATVFDASLTFCQQIIAGDSWGTITISVIEEYPATAIFYALVFLSIGMAVLNLILGVVVDVASQARDRLKGEMEDEDRMKHLEVRSHLLGLCHQLDVDGDGEICKEELEKGFHNNDTFRDALTALDIGEEDLDVLWSILDSDKSGTVTYIEFVSNCYKLKSSNTSYLLAYLKFYITEISSKLGQAMERMEKELEEVVEEDKQIERKCSSISLQESKNGASLSRLENSVATISTSISQVEGKADCVPIALTTPPGQNESDYRDLSHLMGEAKVLIENLSDEFQGLTSGIQQVTTRMQEVTKSRCKEAKDDESEKATLNKCPGNQGFRHPQEHDNHWAELMSTMAEVKEKLDRCPCIYSITAATPQLPATPGVGQVCSVPHERIFDYWHAPASYATKGKVLPLPSAPPPLPMRPPTPPRI
jgi:hypothetical protein